MKKKVLIISYYWPPSGGAGVQRWLKFAKYLPQFEWEPILLTVDENYASYPQKDESLIEEAQKITTYRTKTFELYNLYSSFKKDKQIPYGGFSNEANPGFIQKAARFARGNFFLPDPRKGWNKYAIEKALELIEEHNIQTIITTSPPHSTQLIGLELKKRNAELYWIADLRDPWTDIYFYDKFYPTQWAKRIDKKYEKSIVENADTLITVSKSIKDTLRSRYPNTKNIQVVTNGYDETDFPNELFENQEKNNQIVYTGTLTTAYPIHEVIAIAKNNPTLFFKFIGKTPEEFITLIQEKGLSKQFTFQEAIPHNEIIREMINASVLLLLIPKVPQNNGILTGKLFEYLGSKTPILALGPPNGDAEEIIDETQSGIYISYEKAVSINAQTIKDLQLRKSNNKTQNYSRKNLTKRIVEIIENLKK